MESATSLGITFVSDLFQLEKHNLELLSDAWRQTQCEMVLYSEMIKRMTCWNDLKQKFLSVGWNPWHL